MRKILKESLHFIVEDFAKDTYDNKSVFPQLGIMRGEGIEECPVLDLNLKVDLLKNNETATDTIEKERQEEWNTLMNMRPRAHGDHQGEYLQEIGFIEWARNYYPRSFTVLTDNSTKLVLALNQLHKMSPLPRVFLPFCGMFAGSNNKFNSYGNGPLIDSSNAISQLEKQIPSRNIFYVAAHPRTTVYGAGWEHKANNARTLKIDQTSKGFFMDVIIPISMHLSDLDYFFSRKQNITKKNLLYSCGREHRWSVIYKGLRVKLPEIFNALNKTGIDMSITRTKDEYDHGFRTSKFCFIIPGDTTGTSQASKAMLAGCVPIFIAIDFRDLPFANILNYNSFSLRFHANYFVTGNSTLDENRATKLYQELEDMVQNGTYVELRKNVEVARDFFNYHRFGSRSPYGAALASMYQDDVNENS